MGSRGGSITMVLYHTPTATITKGAKLFSGFVLAMSNVAIINALASPYLSVLKQLDNSRRYFENLILWTSTNVCEKKFQF
jgi:hypothetical protein